MKTTSLFCVIIITDLLLTPLLKPPSHCIDSCSMVHSCLQTLQGNPAAGLRKGLRNCNRLMLKAHTNIRKEK